MSYRTEPAKCVHSVLQFSIGGDLHIVCKGCGQMWTRPPRLRAQPAYLDLSLFTRNRPYYPVSEEM
jgi:hypothetical protein